MRGAMLSKQWPEPRSDAPAHEPRWTPRGVVCTPRHLRRVVGGGGDYDAGDGGSSIRVSRAVDGGGGGGDRDEGDAGTAARGGRGGWC